MARNVCIPGVAGEDLSSALRKPVYFDPADGGRVKLVTANDGAIDGILVLAGADDAVVEVCVGGHIEAIAGGAITQGDAVMWVTPGKVVTATSGDNAFARFVGGVKGGAPVTYEDGDYVQIYVFDHFHTLA